MQLAITKMIYGPIVRFCTNYLGNLYFVPVWDLEKLFPPWRRFFSVSFHPIYIYSTYVIVTQLTAIIILTTELWKTRTSYRLFNWTMVEVAEDFHRLSTNWTTYDAPENPISLFIHQNVTKIFSMSSKMLFETIQMRLLNWKVELKLGCQWWVPISNQILKLFVTHEGSQNWAHYSIDELF